MLKKLAKQQKDRIRQRKCRAAKKNVGVHENKNKIKEQNYKEAQTINKMVDSILKCPSKKEFMKKINPGRYTSPIVKSNLICNLNKLTKYKEKKNMDPFNDLKRHIMDDHLSIAEMSRISEIPSYKIRRLLSVNKKKVDESQYKRKLATRDKQFISDFFRSDYISFDLPDARYARKKYIECHSVMLMKSLKIAIHLDF